MAAVLTKNGRESFMKKSFRDYRILANSYFLWGNKQVIVLFYTKIYKNIE